MDRRSFMRFIPEERTFPAIPLNHSCARQETMNYPLHPQTDYATNHTPYTTPLSRNTNHPSINTPFPTYTRRNPHNSLRRTASSQYPILARTNDNMPYRLVHDQPSRCNQNTTGENNAAEYVSRFGCDSNPDALVHLRDEIMALQIQNLELNLFLKKEELKRKDAEEAVKKERNYIKNLEENIQTLNSSRVIMDPDLYKQVADDYIANHKKPVRRTRTCNPYIVGSSDLTCDDKKRKENSASIWSQPSTFLAVKQELKAKGSQDSSSSTSSKDVFDSQFLPTSETSSPRTSIPYNSPLYSRENSSDSSENYEPEWNIEASSTGTTPLNHEEYQQLLQSLESLDTGSVVS